MGEAISQGGQRSHRAPPSSASAARPHRTEAPGEHLLRRGPMPGLPVGADRPARPSPWPAQQVRLMLAEGSSAPRGNYSETPDMPISRRPSIPPARQEIEQDKTAPRVVNCL